MSSAHDRMADLAERFPTLRGRPGVRPFEPATLEAQLREAWPGSGARHAIRFVLSVWNVHNDAFALTAAWGAWDAAHRAAAQAWLDDPWWP